MNHTFKITIDHNGQLYGTIRKLFTALPRHRPDLALEQLDIGLKTVREACISRINIMTTLQRLRLIV